MAGLKNAFYHRINSLRRTEEPIITKKSPVGSIMMNERGEVKALGKGTVKAGPTKLLVWNKFDQSVRFLSSDNEKVILKNFTDSVFSETVIDSPDLIFFDLEEKCAVKKLFYFAD